MKKKSGCVTKVSVTIFFIFFFAYITAGLNSEEAKRTSAPDTGLLPTASTVAQTYTPAPTATAEPTLTPTPSATHTPVPIDTGAIKEELEKRISKTYSYYDVQVDETGAIIYMTNDGMVSAVSVLKQYYSSSAEVRNTWETMRKSILALHDDIYNYLASCGIDNPTVMVQLVNDENKENVLLGAAYGMIIYDFMSE